MALNILLSQKTNRHIVKKLGSTYAYVSKFGTFGTAKTDNTGLNNPIGIAVDTSNNIYVCDSKNCRIVKLDSSLAFVGSLDLGARNNPYAIMFDSTTGDIYVVGVYKDVYLSIFRVTTSSFTIAKQNNNIYPEAKEKPFSICRGFGVNDFLIALGTKLLKVTEASNSNFTATTITTNETITATSQEALIKEKKYNLVNKPIISSSYTLWRTYTETPTQLSTSTFQTLHFPVLGIPDVDFTVYKNEVELDYDIALDDPNDYIINQTLGFITLQKPVISTDKIYIRYKYQMIDTVDYVLDINTGSLKLTVGVSEDWNGNTDIIQANYTHTGQAVNQTITGISNAVITGLVKHSNGDVYIAQNTLEDAGRICRVNSSYVNIGDSNKVSKFIQGLTEALDGSLLTYCDNQKITRYSSLLNFVEDVYEDDKKTDLSPVFTSHQCTLSSFPIVVNSERVYVGSEILLRDDIDEDDIVIHQRQYALNYLTGVLTIHKIIDDPVNVFVYGSSYQLSKFPIESGSELVYVDNVLQSSGYALDYSTGRLTFSPVISGTVKVEYYRSMTIDKIEFVCVNDTVELDAFDVSSILEINN
jgi:hypothetical protein